MKVNTIAESIDKIGKYLVNINKTPLNTHKEMLNFIISIPKICPPE